MAEGAKSLVRKISISPTSSWITFDSKGQSSILNVDKYGIMRRVQINARDLRILDSLLSYPSTILSREDFIVLNLEHIKAIVTSKEVFLQDPTNEDVVPVVKELERKLPTIVTNQGDDPDCVDDIEKDEDDESPFEFRALDIFLEAICSFLDARATDLEMAIYPALDELTNKISSRNLDQIRKLKNAMTGLTRRVQQVREELEKLIDNDDDMADLYLSRKLVGMSSSPVSESGIANFYASSPSTKSKSVATVLEDENDVEEIEMILEEYFTQIDGTLNRLTTLRGYIDDTEDYINIQIDSHRNQLIQLEVFIYTAEISLAFYSLVTGILGMNLPYSWRTGHEYLFKWVVIFTGVISISIFLTVVYYARKKGLVGS